MRKNTLSLTIIGIIGALFALALLGGGVLVWQAAVFGPELTPAQSQFNELADSIVKSAVGALLGFAGGAGLSRLNGR